MVLTLAAERCGDDLRWLRSVLEYDWALWHARRVSCGWPALTKLDPLIPGASLVKANFDLLSLAKEVRRLNGSAVSPEIYRWRITAGKGQYFSAIFPKDGEVFEAQLDATSFDEIEQTVGKDACDLRAELRTTVEAIGLVLATSFLCCSRELEPSEASAAMSSMVEPAPH
jgi:hypothetical protein